MAFDDVEAEGRAAYRAFWEAVHDQAALDELRAKRPEVWRDYAHTLPKLPAPGSGVTLCDLARLGLHALAGDLEWTFVLASNEQREHPFPNWYRRNREELERRCPDVRAPL